MSEHHTDDPVLQRIRASLHAIYGNRFGRRERAPQ
jgi:hypothetical protein